MKYRSICTDCPPWSSCSTVLWLLLITAVCGCGAIWYKAGSTNGDYQAANDRCQKEGHDEGPGFARCMEEQGWATKHFGLPAAPSDAKKSVTAESPSPPPQTAPATGNVKRNVPVESPPAASRSTAEGDTTKSAVAASPSTPSQPAPAAGDTQSSPTAASVSATSQSAPAAVDAKNNVPAASPPALSAPAPAAGDGAASPEVSDAPAAEQPMVVKNWFKLGGTADDLAAAQARCATKLNIAERPASASQAVSSEMIDCLRNEGWHPF